jgi:hypothetical protein
VNDPIQFAKHVAELVRGEVSRATEPLLARIKELEDRPAPADGAPGLNGTSVTLEDVQPLVAEAVAAIPVPTDGAPGLNGTSVELPDVLAALEPDVKSYLASLPLPADGRDGTSVTLDDVKGLVESNMATWALDFERRAQDVLQRSVDRIPTPAAGKDGRDATSLDDIDLTLAEDGRTVVIRFMAGDEIREKSLKLATIIDRGTYQRGKSYEPGDAVSWGGSLWIAQAVTDESPDESRHGTPWRMGVKKGQNGRDLRPDDPTKSAEVYKLRDKRA